MTAIVVLSAGALPLARRIQEALPGSPVHGLARRVAGTDVPFEHATEHIAALFSAGTAIIGICAAGILVRAVATGLADKRTEPPVVAVAEDGSVVVPLLGGHRGANDLARRIAAAIGATAAITTASDVVFGVALDEPPPGWHVANPERVKPVAAALLAGHKVSVEGGAPFLAGLPRDAAAPWRIRVDEHVPSASDDALVYHPAVLALGVGCERGCAPDELLALVRRTLADAQLAEAAVAGVFSIDLKMDEPAVHAVAAALDVPARFFAAERLVEETPRLANPSETVFRETGTWGVAEAAALAAAGPAASLVVPKRKSARATCAIARAPTPLDGASLGRPRGSLAVIGIGPGSAAWRTPEADALLAASTDVVGYGLYLDLVAPLIRGKRRHEAPLGAEEQRARLALELAAEGGAVSLVSSGDAGIYGMASLVFELVDREDRAEWRRIELRVAPGISALQAAAARLGAPLGHDFCAISLSDLLTARETILRRLDAAAAGDFVLALYNPRSERRRDLLEEARSILLRHRPPETPVALARNLGRNGERVTLTTLAALEADEVDMLTLVLIGSSATRRFGDRLYTPRGYRAGMA